MLTHDALRSRLAAAEEALAEQEAVVLRALREKEEAQLKEYALQVALLLAVVHLVVNYTEGVRAAGSLRPIRRLRLLRQVA